MKKKRNKTRGATPVSRAFRERARARAPPHIERVAHLYARLKRTPKLLSAISVVSDVVTVEWLEASASRKAPVDSAPYRVHDANAERKWGFSLAAALAHTARRGQRTLEGYAVCVAPGARETCTMPPDDALAEMVELAGGCWLPAPTATHDLEVWPHGLFALAGADYALPEPPKATARKKKGAKAAQLSLRDVPPSAMVGLLAPEELYLSLLRKRSPKEQAVPL